MYYSIQQIPEKYQSIVKQLIKAGIISHDETLEAPLSDDMLMILLIMARLGLF